MHVAASVREQRRLEFENMHKRTKSRRFGTPPDFTNVVLMLEQEAIRSSWTSSCIYFASQLHHRWFDKLIERLPLVDQIQSRPIYSGLELFGLT
jgi:hypothetical protein